MEEPNDTIKQKEEASSWAKNFNGLLHHEVGRKIFQQFLQSQYSDENLRFWIAAEEYREVSDDERKITAKQVYEDFVSTVSPCEVSLDAKHRTQIEAGLEAAETDLFKPAQDYIYCLMYRDCFPRFKSCKTYKRVCKYGFP